VRQSIPGSLFGCTRFSQGNLERLQHREILITAASAVGQIFSIIAKNTAFSTDKALTKGFFLYKIVLLAKSAVGWNEAEDEGFGSNGWANQAGQPMFQEAWLNVEHVVWYERLSEVWYGRKTTQRNGHDGRYRARSALTFGR
jgi:hypothetical protein